MGALGVYEFYNCGTCLGDLVPDGSFLTVDPQAEINLGSIVAVVFKKTGPFLAFNRSLSASQLLGVTKIFLGAHQSDAGETIYLVGQLSPPIISPIPASCLDAMHLVIGGQTPEGSIGMSDADRTAMALLGPFFRGLGPYPPVNPQWQPPGEDE